MTDKPEPPEVELARQHTRLSEQCYGIGLWEQATTHASMATMYLAIAARKEAR